MVFLFLKIIITRANPTATSAAATAITKNTATWPSIFWWYLAKAMNARFAAFNISSMDIKIKITFRRITTPMMPMMNRTALKPTTQ